MAERGVTSVELSNPFPKSLDGMCELLLIRHGEQRHTHNMAIGDALNPPLTELGRRQAAAVGSRLADAQVDAVYSSALERANDTGKAVAQHHDLDCVVVPELNEIDLWRDAPQDVGLVDSVGKDRLREIYRESNRTGRWDAYPFSEPRDAFIGRITAALDDIIDRHHGHRVAVACHGGVISTYAARIMESTTDRVVAVHHTSITTVRASGDLRRVLVMNDYAHVLDFQTSLDPLNAS